MKQNNKKNEFLKTRETVNSIVFLDEEGAPENFNFRMENLILQ
jgi:hypothetical protein